MAWSHIAWYQAILVDVLEKRTHEFLLLLFHENLEHHVESCSESEGARGKRARGRKGKKKKTHACTHMSTYAVTRSAHCSRICVHAKVNAVRTLGHYQTE